MVKRRVLSIISLICVSIYLLYSIVKIIVKILSYTSFISLFELLGYSSLIAFLILVITNKQVHIMTTLFLVIYASVPLLATPCVYFYYSFYFSTDYYSLIFNHLGNICSLVIIPLVYLLIVINVLIETLCKVKARYVSISLIILLMVLSTIYHLSSTNIFSYLFEIHIHIAALLTALCYEREGKNRLRT